MHTTLFRFGDRFKKSGVTTLVADPDLTGGNLIKFNDVALGLLADGYDAIGLFTSVFEFISVDTNIDGVVMLGVAFKNEIVDGDDGADAFLAEAPGDLMA